MTRISSYLSRDCVGNRKLRRFKLYLLPALTLFCRIKTVYAIDEFTDSIKRIFFSEDDLVPDMDEAFKRQYFDEDMVIMSEAEADKAFQDGTYNTLVSYVVAPFDPQDGSWCYKMLIDAGTHELLYFRHHRISVRKWAGFLPEDIKTIFARR